MQYVYKIIKFIKHNMINWVEAFNVHNNKHIKQILFAAGVKNMCKHMIYWLDQIWANKSNSPNILLLIHDAIKNISNTFGELPS